MLLLKICLCKVNILAINVQDVSLTACHKPLVLTVPLCGKAARLSASNSGQGAFSLSVQVKGLLKLEITKNLRHQSECNCLQSQV